MLIACGLFRDGDRRPQVTWFANDEWARDRLQEVQVRLQKVDRAMSGLLQRPREVDERFDRRQYGQLL